MKFITVDTYAELSRKAANIIAAQIIAKDDCVLGLATGSSPIGTYDNLVKMYEEGDLDFSKVTSVNLDEYVGLDGESDQSYRWFMNHHLFDRVNIDKTKTFVPGGKVSDLEAEAKAYDKRIKELGGIDLQLLGIGLDGHIGFNEPDSFFTGETHVVKLHPSTIEANARFFSDISEVPTEAITMGMAAIMQAKKVLLIANGPKKKEIIEKAFFGPITPEVPASILQLHPDLTVIFSQYE
ncbi:MAG: glucosamine-6-phosphate deaminase [Acutalibacteraceae bacterium]|nr:glucosamine-6-phosphate deaminase [Acutalibacteraceae bacterium]